MYTFNDNSVTYTALIENGYVQIYSEGTQSAIPIETTGELNIPSKCFIDGNQYTVKSLGSYIFFHTKVTSITVPETVDYIESSAFEGAKATSIDLSRTKVKIIKKYCFSQNIKLENVLLNDLITSIPERAFFWCTSLRYLVLPPRLKKIHFTSFANAEKLKTFIFCGVNDIEIPVQMNSTDILVSYEYPFDSFSGYAVTKMSNICLTSVTLKYTKKTNIYLYISILLMIKI